MKVSHLALLFLATILVFSTVLAIHAHEVKVEFENRYGMEPAQ